MAARTLTYVPWNQAALNYGPAVTKTFSQWGINDSFTGTIKSQVPDEVNLSLVGDALSPVPFAYRSILKLVIDGKPFFTGYVQDDLDREGANNKNEGHVKLGGPWWFLESLPYELDIQVLQSVDPNGNPVWKDTFYTHFTLNAPLVATFTSAKQSGTFFSVFYEVELLNSQKQIAAVLDYAVAHGAYLQYEEADLLAIPVLPADVLNITCAEAIRRQLEAVDAVAWFDYTQDPPKFHCRQRKDLPARTVTIATAKLTTPFATGFRLKERFDLRVPYVVINFEEPYSVGSVNGTNLAQDFYPNPLPQDFFKGLITTVPITSVNGTQQSKFIQTQAIAADNIAWWQLCFPEMDPAKNPNAANDFADLKFTPGTGSSRQTNLPNMIIAGGYAPWMGGHIAQDTIFRQFTYSKQVNNKLPAVQLTAHTKRVTVLATDLNFPDGVNFTITNFTSLGENLADFAGLAQIVYTDLAARQWEGTIPVFEAQYTGLQAMGVNVNVAGGIADWRAMAALVQSISFTVRTGGIHYQLQLGPNKSLSAQNIAQRMKAARQNYITSIFINPAPQNLNSIQHPQQDASQDSSDGHPQHNQHHITAPDNSSGVLITGDPVITLQTYDADGNPQTPASATPGGQIILDLDKVKGSDGKWHTMQIVEMPDCDPDGKQWTRLVLVSERYKAPGQ